eukprot:5721704-Amphidinium_carterae.1
MLRRGMNHDDNGHVSNNIANASEVGADLTSWHHEPCVGSGNAGQEFDSGSQRHSSAQAALEPDNTPPMQTLCDMSASKP